MEMTSPESGYCSNLDLQKLLVPHIFAVFEADHCLPFGNVQGSNPIFLRNSVKIRLLDYAALRIFPTLFIYSAYFFSVIRF